MLSWQKRKNSSAIEKKQLNGSRSTLCHHESAFNCEMYWQIKKVLCLSLSHQINALYGVWLFSNKIKVALKSRFQKR